jgi:crotonobetainyl-CoA:carnitine CoA-transferase CaiB-like acyl-CoA transferase
MAGPLDGYRIVDLTTMLSGPWATSILGDQGADVIKVEVPGEGDHTRSLGNRSGGMAAGFLNINRSKRSLTLNLKHARGKSLLKKLAATADVFVQNFRPGVVERLAVAEPDIREVAPNVVYVSISGFGERGPLADKPVYDPVIQALSGLTTVQAGSDSARPRLVRTILPDKLTAVVASQAISAALLARERTGQGQHVRLAMLDAVVNFLWASDMGGQTFVDRPVSRQAAASFIDLIYETADGHITVSTMRDKEWQALAKAFDKPDLLEDPRFRTPELRDKNVDQRLALVQEVLRGKTSDEWLEIFAREGVPSAPALTRQQVIEHPQIIDNQILFEHEHPVAGRLRQTRTAARFEGTPPHIHRGAPRLGEHNAEILAELGCGDEEIVELRDCGAIGSETYPETATGRRHD